VGVRLTDDEAWDVLATSHTGILTTLRRDGAPVTLPVWFVVDDRTVLVAGLTATAKFTRARNDDRVSFLVESGLRWAELRAVEFTGRAELVASPDWDALDARFDAKYAGFRTPRSEMPASAQAHYDRSRSLLRLVPEGRLLTWDNARLEVRR
jgi:nitroimidazol reductase NimA-like FMN-containing flavoprotein (pyridoxamine 5'-phosphate oxidase superfamily)